MISFQTENSKLIKVLKDESFAGWLERSSHRPTGLNAKRYTIWSGFVSGKYISAPTITAAKAKAAVS